MPFEWRMSAHQWCRANFRFPKISTWIYFDKLSRRRPSGKAVPINSGSPHDVAFVRANNDKKTRNLSIFEEFHFSFRKKKHVRHTDYYYYYRKQKLMEKSLILNVIRIVSLCVPPLPCVWTTSDRDTSQLNEFLLTYILVRTNPSR